MLLSTCRRSSKCGSSRTSAPWRLASARGRERERERDRDRDRDRDRERAFQESFRGKARLAQAEARARRCGSEPTVARAERLRRSSGTDEAPASLLFLSPLQRTAEQATQHPNVHGGDRGAQLASIARWAPCLRSACAAEPSAPQRLCRRAQPLAQRLCRRAQPLAMLRHFAAVLLLLG